MQFNLKPYSELPGHHPRGVRSEVVYTPGNIITVSFALTLTEELPDFQPVKQPRHSRDKLYEHTCFELFLKSGDRYIEWNVAPDGSWYGYAFSQYRTPEPYTLEAFRPQTCEIDVTEKNLKAHFSFALSDHANFLDLSPEANVHGSPCFIFRNQQGASYWSQHHTADNPDFHAPTSFTRL